MDVPQHQHETCYNGEMTGLPDVGVQQGFLEEGKSLS